MYFLKKHGNNDKSRFHQRVVGLKVMTVASLPQTVLLLLAKSTPPPQVHQEYFCQQRLLETAVYYVTDLVKTL